METLYLVPFLERFTLMVYSTASIDSSTLAIKHDSREILRVTRILNWLLHRVYVTRTQRKCRVLRSRILAYCALEATIPGHHSLELRLFLKAKSKGSKMNSCCGVGLRYSLSTSAMLCWRICCRALGLSNSLCTLAMMLSASSFCCLCLTWPS